MNHRKHARLRYHQFERRWLKQLRRLAAANRTLGITVAHGDVMT